MCASLDGGAGRSCSINLNTGIWADFSADEIRGRDLIALYAQMHHINNGQAAKELSEKYGDAPAVTRPKPNGHADPAQKIAYVVPDDAPEPDLHHRDHGDPSRTWVYRDAEGRRLMIVARYDPPDGGKQFCPFVWDGKRWQKRHWHEPAPLYGLDDLALRPDCSVIIVEGEKAADAARKLCPGQVVVTWPGGSNRWHKADFSAIYGRKIVLWPDNDQAGLQAMHGLARALQSHCPTIKIFNVSDMPAKWDAADAVEAGWTGQQFAEWAQAHMTDIPVLTEAVSRTVKGAVDTPPGAAAAAKPNGHALVSCYSRWEQWGLSKTGSMPNPNVDNCVAILENDPVFKDRIWYDEFLCKYMVTDPSGRTREWEESDEIQLQVYIQRELGIHRMGSEAVRRAFISVARRHVRNCVRDWLDSLVWDGIPRIAKFLEDCFHASPTSYVSAASQNFWLSMVARIYRPGCKVDNVIVLEGGQGVGKSKALQIIGGPYWAEQHAGLGSNQFYEVLQGKMLIEIGEMDAFRRSDDAEVKRAVTCPTDRYREPYATKAADHPRQCVFVGNSNRDDYLKDESGGRRWWPITVGGDVELGIITANRDQFFAEAVVLLNPKGGWNEELWHFNGGQKWWEMPKGQTENEQEKRLQDDPWTEHIVRYLDYEHIGNEWTPRLVPMNQVTMNEILMNALFFKEVSRIQRSDEKRAGACLTALKFKKYSARTSDPDVFTKIWRRRDATG